MTHCRLHPLSSTHPPRDARARARCARSSPMQNRSRKAVGRKPTFAGLDFGKSSQRRFPLISTPSFVSVSPLLARRIGGVSSMDRGFPQRSRLAPRREMKSVLRSFHATANSVERHLIKEYQRIQVTGYMYIYTYIYINKMFVKPHTLATRRSQGLHVGPRRPNARRNRRDPSCDVRKGRPERDERTKQHRYGPNTLIW